MRANYLALVMLPALFALPALAEESDGEISMELIEFLGEWEAGDGSWVDPFTLSEEESDGQGETDE